MDSMGMSAMTSDLNATLRFVSWLVYHERPIALSSGRMSHWYVDAQTIFEYEVLRDAVLRHWLTALSPDFSWTVIPVPTGGHQWAAALQQLAPRQGSQERTVVVEDVTTTGKSAIAVRNEQAPFAPIFAVVARGSFQPDRCWERLYLEDW